MSSRFLRAAPGLAVAAALAVASAALGDAGRALRVCADPNNLPFSNERGEGFENRLAEIVAADLGAHVEYTWWAQRRGFVRNTIGAATATSSWAYRAISTPCSRRRRTIDR